MPWGQYPGWDFRTWEVYSHTLSVTTEAHSPGFSSCALSARTQLLTLSPVEAQEDRRSGEGAQSGTWLLAFLRSTRRPGGPAGRSPHCPHKNKRKKQSNLRGISLQENKTKKHSIQLYSFPPLKIRFSLSGYLPSIHEPQLLPRTSPPPQIW